MAGEAQSAAFLRSCMYEILFHSSILEKELGDTVVSGKNRTVNTIGECRLAKAVTSGGRCHKGFIHLCRENVELAFRIERREDIVVIDRRGRRTRIGLQLGPAR